MQKKPRRTSIWALFNSFNSFPVCLRGWAAGSREQFNPCSGLEEDKAEIFANMMANYKEVQSRSETDPVIKAKVAQMKKLLYKFCPAFNELLWSEVSEKTPSQK